MNGVQRAIISLVGLWVLVTLLFPPFEFRALNGAILNGEYVRGGRGDV